MDAECDVSRTWVVVAAFDEGPVIRAVAEELVAAGWRVVVVDDGSGDNTFTAASIPGVTMLRHVLNLGQGAALQTGIDYAIARGAQVVVTFDADGQHEAAEIPALVGALSKEHADIALGSRFLGRLEGVTRRRRALLKLAVGVSNRLSGMRLTDAHCGIRAIRVSAMPFLRITQDRMAHASELLRKIKAHHLRVVEVPVTVRYTAHSMTKGQTALQAVRILFEYFFR